MDFSTVFFYIQYKYMYIEKKKMHDIGSGASKKYLMHWALIFHLPHSPSSSSFHQCKPRLHPDGTTDAAGTAHSSWRQPAYWSRAHGHSHLKLDKVFHVIYIRLKVYASCLSLNICQGLFLSMVKHCFRWDHSGYELRHWEMALHCNAISHSMAEPIPRMTLA